MIVQKAAHLVGPMVIQRLEDIGLDSFEKLKTANAEMICALVAERLGSTCWKNNPQSRQAITNAIAVAKQHA